MNELKIPRYYEEFFFFPDSYKNKSAIGVKSLVASDLKYKEELVTSYLGSCLEYVTS